MTPENGSHGLVDSEQLLPFVLAHIVSGIYQTLSRASLQDLLSSQSKQHFLLFHFPVL
jgi:hypothetical protein